MASEDATAALAAALRGDGLVDHMADLISDEQLVKLEEIQERKKNNTIESTALKSLSKLQQALDLDDDQKDQVYDLLLEDAEKNLDSESDAELVTKTMMSGMGVDLDLESMGISELFNMSNSPDPGVTDKESLMEKMAEARQNSINEKVERFSSILNETQQAQYRKDLESKGGLGNSIMQFEISQ